MKIAIIRAHKEVFCPKECHTKIGQAIESLSAKMFDSATKNIGREFMRTGLASSFFEWRFWGFPTLEFAYDGVPLRMFHSRDGEDMTELEDYLAQVGVPDVIWAEGMGMPITLHRVLSLCSGSLKIVYPKYCQPWLTEGLDAYDVCLVDEDWQIEEMARRHPAVKCRVWDKLVDYDHVFFPTNAAKKYDICYVARLDPRKNHKLLFQALAELPDRKFSVVLVGSDWTECQPYLEPMAKEAGVEAIFSGQVPPRRVNELINESRMGVLCDQYDAVPRAMLECMAADVPVLVNSEMRAGTRYVTPEAGLIRPPAQFHNGIAEILDNLDRFRPREHLLKNYSRQQAAGKMWKILRDSLEAKQGTTVKERYAN